MEKVPAELMKEYVNSQKFTSTTEIMEAMKAMFGDVLQQVMEAELDTKLGYEKSERIITLSGYSKTHLTRLMRKYYGVSVHEFIRDARLEAAYNSLVLTSLYPEDISEELGYSSFSHFQQIFKKKYGITPAMLRKKYSSITI